MLRIVTDSAGDMPPEWRREYEIHVVPVNIHFGPGTMGLIAYPLD
ncbi:MAG: hypothetical protein AABZ58_00120 [Chloroflexota bacterium]|jgi:fatty acid-binding protein DegV